MVKNFVIALSALLLATTANAADKWNFVKDGSKLEFKATQNNAPVTGSFTDFDAEINFSENDLKGSSVKVNVDTNGIEASYAEVATTLKTPDWFSVDVFPKAVFEASNFTKLDDKNYEADGTLTIRDKTVPVKLKFAFDNYSTNEAIAKGSTTLLRNDFGIGQGDWVKTDTVKNEVEVTFTIKATK